MEYLEVDVKKVILSIGALAALAITAPVSSAFPLAPIIAQAANAIGAVDIKRHTAIEKKLNKVIINAIKEAFSEANLIFTHYDEIIDNCFSIENADTYLREREPLDALTTDIEALVTQYIFDSTQNTRPDFKAISENILLNIEKGIAKSKELGDLEHRILTQQIWEKLYNENSAEKENIKSNNNAEDNRFKILVNDHNSFNIYKDYTEYNKIKRCVSYGVNDDINVNKYKNGFKMELDLKSCPSIGKQEFVMAYLDYVPPEDWILFYENDYSIDFDITASPGIFAVQLEIKDKSKDKFVDLEIAISAKKPHQHLLLNRLTRQYKAWGEIKEICFTVFINDRYIKASSGKISISNFVLTHQ